MDQLHFVATIMLKKSFVSSNILRSQTIQAKKSRDCFVEKISVINRIRHRKYIKGTNFLTGLLDLWLVHDKVWKFELFLRPQVIILVKCPSWPESEDLKVYEKLKWIQNIWYLLLEEETRCFLIDFRRL